MGDYQLKSRPALDGYANTFGATSLREVVDMAIVSMAIPLGGETLFGKSLKAAFGVDAPKPGTSVISADKKTRIVGQSSDQFLAFFVHPSPDAESIVSAAINRAAYTTDQTDVWVGLEIAGDDVRSALERICPIDLQADRFGIGASARTSMEHLGVLIIRTGENRFELYSASSSAKSFLHALETSIKNVT